MEYELQTIRGKVPSKSNCYKVITLCGHGSIAKQKILKDYEKSFYLQCDKYRNKNLSGLFALNLNVFYENQRPDLDNCLKVILDCLQGCNAITNDRNCVRVEANKFIDKANPRIEFTIKEVNI
jgi:Holliday junction resolvase RusA-like endonuclease